MPTVSRARFQHTAFALHLYRLLTTRPTLRATLNRVAPSAKNNCF
jgi:hypothetical protein